MLQGAPPPRYHIVTFEGNTKSAPTGRVVGITSIKKHTTLAESSWHLQVAVCEIFVFVFLVVKTVFCCNSLVLVANTFVLVYPGFLTEALQIGLLAAPVVPYIQQRSMGKPTQYTGMYMLLLRY